MAESTSRSGQIYWRALEPFADAVSIYDGPDVFQRQFSRLPPPIAVLFAAHWLDSEVRNGGFEQLFFNSTGILALEAHSAFQTLEFEDAAAIIQEAMSTFGPEYPRDRGARCTFLKDILSGTGGQENRFDALDTRYYEFVPFERFEGAADSYASRNVA